MQHVKMCRKAAAMVCESHCQQCSEYDNTLSIGICRFNFEKLRITAAEELRQRAKKKLELRGIQLIFNKEKREYVVFAPWDGEKGRYDIFKEADAFSAWDCFLMRADKSGRFEIKAALKERRPPELGCELRGVEMHRAEGGVWYISRGNRPEDVIAENEPLAAWVRFLETVDIVVRPSIAKAVKNF